MHDEALKDLRWLISDAFCAGRRDCKCTQDQIDAAEGACWEYADATIARNPKTIESVIGDSVTRALPKTKKTL